MVDNKIWVGQNYIKIRRPPKDFGLLYNDFQGQGPVLSCRGYLGKISLLGPTP